MIASTSQQDRVLDGALACVARVGLGKTTLDDVAREAGCARATVYRCFPGKQALFAAVLERELDALGDRVVAAAAKADALADAIVALAGDLSRAAKMGAAGRMRALSEFTPERCVERVEELYARALDPAPT